MSVERRYSFPTDLSHISVMSEEIRELLKGTAFEEDEANILLIVREALANAMKHGNRFDADKTVNFNVALKDEKLTLHIEDEGDGFIPSEVPDPLAMDNIDRPSGRGLFLIRQFSGNVEHNDKGNSITITLHANPGGEVE